MSIRARRVQVHPFDGYWEDIGTIRSFYDANLALAKVPPPFEFESALGPIYTHARSLPPARIYGATIRESLVADGCVIESGATIEHSVIGLRCHIGRNTTIRNSIVMGADFYASDEPRETGSAEPCLGVCDGSVITGAIIDKNCHIGCNVRIESRGGPDADYDNLSIRDGIIVAHKGAVFPDGWTLPDRGRA
jgi:glucose-1-phosphate adenylyltransferase